MTLTQAPVRGRSLRVLTRSVTGRGDPQLGVLVTAGRDTDGYYVTRVGADSDDMVTAVRWDHEWDDTRSYTVEVAAGPSPRSLSCTCPAHRMRRDGVPCRHRAATDALLERGELAPVG